MSTTPFLKISDDVETALAEGRAVVALESTIITHGMPFPQNLEMARFTAQRGRSWVALWAELSACKSPVDVAKAQLKFWHTASLQYSEAAHRLWHVWATPGASSLPDEEAQAQRPHDFIEVRQPVEAKRAAA